MNIMASRWIDWIRKFASDNNTTYACALSNPECAESYREEYNKKAKPKKPKKSLFDKTSEARAIMLRENAKKSLAKTQASLKNIPANPDTIGALKLAPNRLSINTTPIELPAEIVVPRRAAAAVAEVISPVVPVAKKTKSKKTKESAEESVKMPPIPASLKPIGVAYDYLLNNQSATLPENMIGRIPAESREVIRIGRTPVLANKVIPTDSHRMFTIGRKFLTADFAYSGDKHEDRKPFPYVIVYVVVNVGDKMITFLPFKDGLTLAELLEKGRGEAGSRTNYLQRKNQARVVSIVNKFIPLTDEEASLIYNRPEALHDSKFVYKGQTKVGERAKFLDFLDRLNANRDSPPYVNIFEGHKLWVERGNEPYFNDEVLRSMRMDAELIRQIKELVPKNPYAYRTFKNFDEAVLTPEKIKQDVIFPHLAWKDIRTLNTVARVMGNFRFISNNSFLLPFIKDDEQSILSRDDPQFIQKFIEQVKREWMELENKVEDEKRKEQERKVQAALVREQDRIAYEKGAPMRAKIQAARAKEEAEFEAAWEQESKKIEARLEAAKQAKRKVNPLPKDTKERNAILKAEKKAELDVFQAEREKFIDEYAKRLGV